MISQLLGLGGLIALIFVLRHEIDLHRDYLRRTGKES